MITLIPQRLRRRLGSPNFVRILQTSSFRELLDSEQSLALDIGSGDMSFVSRITKGKFRKCLCVDLDSETLSTSRFRSQDIIPIVATAERLPFDDNIFDVVVLSSVLQMVSHPDVLLAEIHRVLKPYGSAVISIPGPYDFITRFVSSRFGRAVTWALRLPSDPNEIEARVTKNFGAWKSPSDLTEGVVRELCQQSRLFPTRVAYAPSKNAMRIWQLACLLSLRLGKLPFRVTVLLLPLVQILGGSHSTDSPTEILLRVRKTEDISPCAM